MRRDLSIGMIVGVAMVSGYLYAANFKTIEMSNAAKWEYKCHRIVGDEEMPVEARIEKRINEVTVNGWEFVQLVPTVEPHIYLMTTRRPKIEQTPPARK